jgi:hypothetical protein
VLANNSTNINKITITSPQTKEHKKIMTYDFGNPGSGLGQALICGRINWTETISVVFIHCTGVDLEAIKSWHCLSK